MKYARENILRLVENIDPFDSLEEDHQQDVIAWIKSGAEIFRIEKPDKPAKHLVSYFVAIDIENTSILLVDHIKSGRWLPTGGHVEKDEDPKATVQREALEELGIQAEFISENPFFLTVTVTVGKTAGHTDVSLWYLIQGSIDDYFQCDDQEFNGYRWFSFDEVHNNTSLPFDPHMDRFTKKLEAFLKSQKNQPDPKGRE